MLDILIDQNRLETVHYLDRYNPNPGKVLQNYVSLASELFDVDYTGVHFLTDTHQEIKSHRGLDLPRLEIENSVCQYTLRQEEPLLITDLEEDPRTEDFWYVKDNPNVKSYLGVPLQTEEGVQPGTLCLLDTETRNFSSKDINLLSTLAEEVIEKLQMNASLVEYQHQAEKTEWMIREIHHRLKNNLAVISGLMDLEALRVDHPETKKVLDSMQNRLKSIADVHRKLYESESYEDLNLLEYTRDLVQNINRSYDQDNKRVDSKVEGESYSLSEDKAVTFGLLVNELVTNAYKHAFNETDHGHIQVVLQKNEGEELCTLIVEDDGDGMPENFDPESEETLGFQLFESLVDQLQGNYSLDTKPGEGTRIEVKFAQ